MKPSEDYTKAQLREEKERLLVTQRGLMAQIEELQKHNEELLTIALWGARRLKAADYQMFTYEWLESLTGKDLSEYKAEVKRR